jgi:hypothetical protein
MAYLVQNNNLNHVLPSDLPATAYNLRLLSLNSLADIYIEIKRSRGCRTARPGRQTTPAGDSGAYQFPCFRLFPFDWQRLVLALPAARLLLFTMGKRA